MRLFITIISEIVIVLSLKSSSPWKERVAAVLIINAFTHPIAMYVLHVRDGYYAVVEIIVLLVEMFWYIFALSVSWRRALGLSLAANAGSIMLGIGIRLLLGIY